MYEAPIDNEIYDQLNQTNSDVNRFIVLIVQGMLFAKIELQNNL